MRKEIEAGKIAAFGAMICLAVCTTTPGNAQLDPPQLLPNSFTDIGTVPKGCIFVLPSALSASPALFYDQSFSVVTDSGSTGSIQIRAWRQGCFEPDRSAIILNLTDLGGNNPVSYPRNVFFDSPQLSEPEPMSFGLLQRTAAWGASPNGILVPQFLDNIEDGVSLVIDARADNVSPTTYNGVGTLIADFGNNQGVSIPVPAYDPQLDPKPFEAQPLSGRHSGQWTVDGLPRSGLVLQVAEIQPDRNFIFAIWFTYLEQSPIWVVGNADLELGNSEVVIPMAILDGGGFITQPGSFTSDDVNVSQVGTMTLRSVHCNRLEGEIDFSASGLGQQSLEFSRLIRIAGYDCDQTQ